MKKLLITIILLITVLASDSYGQAFVGFLNFTWDDETGELLLEVPKAKLGEEFLYISSLAAGVGSNDIGLDRGQLSDEKVVYFYKSGKRLLLVQSNLKYRALSDNLDEVAAVDEAFAKSVLWGFEIKESLGSSIKVDMSPFLIRDAHGVAKTLENKKQGKYKIDKSKSVIYKEGLFNFPNNSEFEAIITFEGNAKGDWIRSVTPTADLVSVRMHHSFIQLPDDNYKPRQFHPASGFNYIGFYDYANPIGVDMMQRWIARHRLEKKNAGAAPSEAKEPIVYYIDAGCPEPVRSALIEGGAWWNQAFEAAGFIDAFQIKDLPKGAHPLDVRYNMIQWVHRSTRGWSYGASITDPRTGEILKGHVSLGSLRVRQDYLIAQGLVSNFDEDKDDPRMLEMALARLRQLSAHEIGHTIGLAHNFASSYNDRASVMDYPHPLITVENNGELNFSASYDDKIGAWDKRAIIYGYASPDKNQSEKDFLESLILQNEQEGYMFITDQDARPKGGLHPYAHLWDNGKKPYDELNRLIDLRESSLKKLSSKSIKIGVPDSELEKVLVPVYLMHRYQVDATSKMIGGAHYSYSINTGKKVNVITPVDLDEQRKALDAMLSTLDIEFLEIPQDVLDLLPPPAFGYPRDRETFKGNMGGLFDPLVAAEASANNTLEFLLNPQRLARIEMQEDGVWTLGAYLSNIVNHISAQTNVNEDYRLMLEKLIYLHLLKLATDQKVAKNVSSAAYYQLNQLDRSMKVLGTVKQKAHVIYLQDIASRFKESPEDFKLPSLPKLPPGSPIGCY